MRLYLNGSVHVIAQLGPDFMIMADAPTYPAAAAEISVTIDGDETRWPIRLPQGIDPHTPRTPIAPIN